MAKLSQAQIEMYAQAAGMANPKLAAAVAMAESGGNPRAHNPVPPDNSYGLWQINMLGGLGPDRRKKLGISSNSALFDPAVNARAAAMISSGGANWKPWSTYTNGAYKKYYGSGGGSADQADFWDGLAEGATAPLDSDFLEVAYETGSVIVDAANWIADPHNWVRIAYAFVGGALVLVGLSIITGTQNLKRLAPVVDYVPGGKAVKSAVKSAGKGKAAASAAKKTAAPRPAPRPAAPSNGGTA